MSADPPAWASLGDALAEQVGAAYFQDRVTKVAGEALALLGPLRVGARP